MGLIVRFCFLAISSLSLFGCAVGNQYDYQAAISLPLSGQGELGLGVIDNRSYVRSGDKPDDFTGIQRGGFGNPFSVTTASGKPLADEFSTTIESALRKNGFFVNTLSFRSADNSVIESTIKASGLQKNIVLKIEEWKTDAMMRLRLIYNLDLSVFDENGELLANVVDSGDEVISGAGFEGGNSRNAAAAFETKVGRLFNSPQLQSAFSK